MNTCRSNFWVAVNGGERRFVRLVVAEVVLATLNSPEPFFFAAPPPPATPKLFDEPADDFRLIKPAKDDPPPCFKDAACSPSLFFLKLRVGMFHLADFRDCRRTVK